MLYDETQTIHIPGDFNGDGRTDVLKWQEDGNIHLFMSYGDGTFNAISNPPGIGNMPYWKAHTAHVSGDYNGDGQFTENAIVAPPEENFSEEGRKSFEN